MAHTILAIDDEREFVDAIKMRLEAIGYHVIAAYNGRAGLEAARRASPDLILLDLVMPGMDGFTVLSELKNDPYTTAIPVVILTAKEEAGYITDAESLGAAAYLAKPLKMWELEAVLQKFFDEE